MSVEEVNKAFGNRSSIKITRSAEEICAIIKSAFKPLRCVAEIWDYEMKIRFRVFDPNDEALFTCKNAITSDLQDDATLNAIILEARSKLESKGLTLMPWHPDDVHQQGVQADGPASGGPTT